MSNVIRMKNTNTFYFIYYIFVCKVSGKSGNMLIHFKNSEF